MKTLISNTSFGELCKSKENEFSRRIDYLDWFERVRNNFDNFLKQALKLEMFAPCDEDGNVLFNPFADDNDAGTAKEYKQTQYNKAKEKVLFEGFEITDETEFLISKYGFSLYFNQIEDFNIEHLLTWSNEIQLTENAIKQIGL